MFTYTSGSITNTSKDHQAQNHNLQTNDHMNHENTQGEMLFLSPKEQVPSMVKHTSPFPLINIIKDYKHRPATTMHKMRAPSYNNSSTRHHVER